MAELPSVFIPDEAEENPFAPIPAGWYVGEIVKSTLKTTKDKTGKYLELAFKITEGEKIGRTLYTNLNLVNKSDMAVKIARSDLKSICKAVDLEGDLEDSEDLHNIDIGIKVSVKAETVDWPAKNEIKGYKAASEVEEESPLR